MKSETGMVSARRAESIPNWASPSSAPGMPFKLWRSILRRCPKAAAVSRSRIEGSMPSGSAAGRRWTIAEATLGGGGKGAAVNRERDAGLGAPLRRDRQAAVMVAVGARHDPLGDFALEHQGQRAPPRRPRTGQPAQQQGRPDIVGQIGDDMRAVADQAALVDLHRVAFDQLELAGKVGAQFFQRGDAAAVALDRYDSCAGIEQGAGQAAGAGADFVDGVAVADPRNGGDARQQLAIEDEVLAQRLGRRQAVAGDDVAQRFGGVAHRAPARCAALDSAWRMAAAIARGSARSLPAMSNAVPWSGAVRTIAGQA